ncbi:MAG: hypothetical protein V4669_17510 [Pseudomonadota bacterium]
MQSQMIAIVLCVFATTAGAHSLAEPASAAPAVHRADPSHVTPARAGAARVRAADPASARPGLITAAAASTTDVPPLARDNVARATLSAPDETLPHEQRGTAGMVLAALALMSGIALRRYGSTS